MKKTLVVAALALCLALPQGCHNWRITGEAEAGMGDVSRAGTNVKAWVDYSKQIITLNNSTCATYRTFRAGLGKDIADASNAELASALGLINGVSVDASTATDIKTTMKAVESICKIADAAAAMLPPNN